MPVGLETDAAEALAAMPSLASLRRQQRQRQLGLGPWAAEVVGDSLREEQQRLYEQQAQGEAVVKLEAGDDDGSGVGDEEVT